MRPDVAFVDYIPNDIERLARLNHTAPQHSMGPYLSYGPSLEYAPTTHS